MKSFSAIQIGIGSLQLAGFVLLTALFFVKPDSVPGAINESLDLIVGAWIVNTTTVVNWVFGSSKGSADKTELIARKG
jgi:hypothetical protein